MQDSTESRIWAEILNMVRIRKNVFKETTGGDGTMPACAQYSGHTVPAQLFFHVHVKSSKHELTVCAT